MCNSLETLQVLYSLYDSPGQQDHDAKRGERQRLPERVRDQNGLAPSLLLAHPEGERRHARCCDT